MFQNLKLRWTIIASVIAMSIYFIAPTYELYSIKNDPELSDIDIDYLKEDAMKLGLDLQGGLYIILELDHQAYLLQNANSKLSFDKKNELMNIISLAIEQATTNQSDVLYALQNISQKEDIKLMQYYSRLIRSHQGKDNNDVIAILKDSRTESMSSILEIMRNRIESHNQYGVGEPSIQKLGNDRLVIELAGVTDVTKAKEYVQRTAQFELILVEDLKIFIVALLCASNIDPIFFFLKKPILFGILFSKILFLSALFKELKKKV